MVSLGPAGSGRRDPEDARDGRRPLGARQRRRRSQGADLVTTAHALAGALEREEADLVLFGQQSADGDGACLWAAVAELLRRPAISQVAELSVDGGRRDGPAPDRVGYERIRAPLPAVVAVSDAINEPRYPSLKGIMGAKSKPQETLGAGRRRRRRGGADDGDRAARRRRRAATGAGVEDGGAAPEAIVEFLVERRLL